jgi:hypothetical protein
MYHGASCGSSFSETKQTPLAHLKTPISVIVQVLPALTEGVGINAATRLYGGQQKQYLSLARATQWRKKTLLLFALTHQFLQQMIEGDELYTRVNKKVAPDASQPRFKG